MGIRILKTTYMRIQILKTLQINADPDPQKQSCGSVSGSAPFPLIRICFLVTDPDLNSLNVFRKVPYHRQN